MSGKKQKVEMAPQPMELENQFILRLPETVAKTLHEALQTGNLKDRMTIKLEKDLRNGEVQLDNWLLHTKVVDLPTILESLKTIDKKNFFKTADICQMMICKGQGDVLDTKNESTGEAQKKHLWPHGITPPCKNMRKRRFREVLNQANIEEPEVEKELKRLLRNDIDAVKVEFEIIGDEQPLEHNEEEFYEDEFLNESPNELDKNNDSSSQSDINVESDGGNDELPTTSAAARSVGQHDIFGGVISSSDDEPMTDLTTQFSPSKLGKGASMTDDRSDDPSQVSKMDIQNKIDKLRKEHEALREQRDIKYNEISTIDNLTLKLRMYGVWQNLVIKVAQMENELEACEQLLVGTDTD